MPLTAFDHVNIRTCNLDTMIAWYDEVLGLPSGPRANFSFPGAWLYLGDRAVVHLVGVGSRTETGGNLALEHFAFRATGFSELCDRLKAQDIPHSVDPVPGFPIVQINLRDPDGNHIHIDFDAAEVPAGT
ncbi:VOC family protein [Phaeobacter marinintestinus]|uniref:VOC family protein n=1 Tax=Falsiphaeobacter marinintestinus TaxID=1492905 RepID=UPI0011B75752|nr:VOC family protein [Phaeobacter marinintestinus]